MCGSVRFAHEFHCGICLGHRAAIVSVATVSRLVSVMEMGCDLCAVRAVEPRHVVSRMASALH
jgi:hypothetical protein